MSTACDRTIDLLAEGLALDAEANAHVRECEHCRALAGEDDALLAAMADNGPAPAMSSALAAVAAAPIAPVRLRAPVARAIAALAPAAVIVGVVVMVAIRRDFSTLSWMARWAPVLSLATLGVLGIVGTVYRGKDNLGASHATRIALAVTTVGVFEVLALTIGDRPLWGGEASHHIECALWGSAVPWALVPLTMLALRGLDPVRPGLTGAAVGASVAALTSVIQHFTCASPSLFHTAVSHGASFIVCTAVGAWLGRRWLAP
ncbi:MAG: DUF1109 family protein [Myxococcales bacterium]|nr:DUF1109 family protein [Myxococcales bacterium]